MKEMEAMTKAPNSPLGTSLLSFFTTGMELGSSQQGTSEHFIDTTSVNANQTSAKVLMMVIETV